MFDHGLAIVDSELGRLAHLMFNRKMVVTAEILQKNHQRLSQGEAYTLEVSARNKKGRNALMRGELLDADGNIVQEYEARFVMMDFGLKRAKANISKKPAN